MWRETPHPSPPVIFAMRCGSLPSDKIIIKYKNELFAENVR